MAVTLAAGKQTRKVFIELISGRRFSVFFVLLGIDGHKWPFSGGINVALPLVSFQHFNACGFLCANNANFGTNYALPLFVVLRLFQRFLQAGFREMLFLRDRLLLQSTVYFEIGIVFQENIFSGDTKQANGKFVLHDNMMLRYLSSLLLLLSPFTGVERRAAPQPAPAELRGVDVSHYQLDIEWETVAAQHPVDFAFVKATEGHDYVDSLFCRNWESLGALGIRRGAYHFFRAYGCGEEQADNFLTWVEMRPGDLAPVLDIERTDGIEPEIMLEEARIWLREVEAELKIKPIIYTNQHFYDRYLAGHFDNYPLWIARYSEEQPILRDGKNWDFWQYSCQGCVDGISQKVDLNVFSGTNEMLDRLCWYPAVTPEATAMP